MKKKIVLSSLIFLNLMAVGQSTDPKFIKERNKQISQMQQAGFNIEKLTQSDAKVFVYKNDDISKWEETLYVDDADNYYFFYYEFGTTFKCRIFDNATITSKSKMDLPKEGKKMESFTKIEDYPSTYVNFAKKLYYRMTYSFKYDLSTSVKIYNVAVDVVKFQNAKQMQEIFTDGLLKGYEKYLADSLRPYRMADSIRQAGIEAQKLKRTIDSLAYLYKKQKEINSSMHYASYFDSKKMNSIHGLLNDTYPYKYLNHNWPQPFLLIFFGDSAHIAEMQVTDIQRGYYFFSSCRINFGDIIGFNEAVPSFYSMDAFQIKENMDKIKAALLNCWKNYYKEYANEYLYKDMVFKRVGAYGDHVKEFYEFAKQDYNINTGEITFSTLGIHEKTKRNENDWASFFSPSDFPKKLTYKIPDAVAKQLTQGSKTFYETIIYAKTIKSFVTDGEMLFTPSIVVPFTASKVYINFYKEEAYDRLAQEFCGKPVLRIVLVCIEEMNSYIWEISKLEY